MQHTAHNRDTKQDILYAARVIIGRTGFASAGLNEILAAADVPKGSFYHYFKSKDALGVEVLEEYFRSYADLIDDIFSRPDLNGYDRLMLYWKRWMSSQRVGEKTSKCLTVKLGAEVSDMSEPMRRVLIEGTDNIISKIAGAIECAILDGSISISEKPKKTAKMFYEMWLGATLLFKITHNDDVLIDTYLTTQRFFDPNTIKSAEIEEPLIDAFG